MLPIKISNKAYKTSAAIHLAQLKSIQLISLDQKSEMENPRGAPCHPYYTFPARDEWHLLCLFYVRNYDKNKEWAYMINTQAIKGQIRHKTVNTH